MPLKREQGLVNQPPRRPKASKSKINTTPGTSVTGRDAGAGKRGLTPAGTRRGKVPTTSLTDVRNVGRLDNRGL